MTTDKEAYKSFSDLFGPTVEVVTSLVKTITYGSEITEEVAIEKDDIACALIGIVENEVILVLAVERRFWGRTFQV